jgi:hypothetical protein
MIALLAAACTEATQPQQPQPKPAETLDARVTAADATVTSTRSVLLPRPREPHRAEVQIVLERLEAGVKDGATDPKNPWALAHGIVAFGKDLKASDGRLAIDVIVSDFAEVQKPPRGRAFFAFPPTAKDGMPIEPHRHEMVSTMLEAGVPPERSFKLKRGGTVTLAQLLRDAEYTFVFPADAAQTRNYAWSAQALLRAHAKDGKIETATGTTTLATLADRTIGYAEQEHAFLEPLMDQGRPDLVEKRKQGVYAHACGGLHLVQAALLAAATTKDPGHLRRAKRQLDIVLFRWEAERRIYKEFRKEQPKYVNLLLVQELKFYGHVLETFGLAREWGVFDADPAAEKKLRQVAGDLVDVVHELQPMYARQHVIGEVAPQTRYDLIGDGCHAIRGLRRSLVAFFAP